MKYVQPIKKRDRRGRVTMHYYFRQDGFNSVALKGNPDRSAPDYSVEAGTRYDQIVAERKTGKSAVHPGAKGTVGKLVSDYLASPDFLNRPESMRRQNRPHLERFGTEFADGPVVELKRKHLKAEMSKMRAKYAKANEWRGAIIDLFDYAVEEEAILVNPAAKLDKFEAPNPDGFHEWSLDQIAQFQAKHGGTLQGLAMELMSLSAMRRGDVIRACKAWITRGETTWDYVQDKNSGNVKRNHMVVEIYPPLLAIIKATPGGWARVGVDPTVPFLRNEHGRAMTKSGFTKWFGKAVKDAALPPACTPHGLRKAAACRLAFTGCTVHQIAAITGHRDLKEIERYTRQFERFKASQDANRRLMEGA